MTIKAIVMPRWGMEMSEGDISAWHSSVGDQVNEGDDLVDVETSKIVNTVTATSGGVLRAILANPGESHAVGAALGVISDADESDDDIQAFIAANGGSAAPAPAAEPEEAAPAAEPAATAPAEEAKTPAPTPAPSGPSLGALAEGGDDSAVAASPVARRLAKEYGVNLNNISGTGRHGRVSKADLESAVSAAGGKLIGSTSGKSAPSTSFGDDSGVKATPVARRLAKELDINLHECRVSGDRGRVCKADVEAAAAIREHQSEHDPDRYFDDPESL